MNIAITQLGKRCKKVRIKRSYSQKRLAAEVKLTQGYVSKIESGAVLPTSVYLRRLSELLNIPVQLLREGKLDA